MPNIFELILTLRAVLSTESASADALEEALLSIKRERKGIQTQQVIFRATDDMRAKLDALSSKFNASNSDVMRVLIENAYGMLCQDRPPTSANGDK